VTQRWDVAVVGAGIHGVGVAQAAAAAGHSVLLLECQAVAAGSSSRSSKLVHGGLRYLESGQLRLVRESLHERTLLLRLAPELVHMQKFHIPIYRHTRRRPWQLRTGLSLYALLAGFAPGSRFGSVPHSQWSQLDGLDTRGLEQVFWYHDAQTDDAALTAAVLRSAQSLGAELQLPARFVGATVHAAGVRLRYTRQAEECEAEARVLVNAAGPWAAQVAHAVTPAVMVPALQLVQGTHIVLATPPAAGIYYVESPRDGRAIFVMPWQGRMLVGTTEVPFHGDPATVSPSAREVQYLLGVLRHYFPALRSSEQARVESAFAGLRVLPVGRGHAFHRSRETLLLADRASGPRLLSIYGGKLTTWRAVAERALARIAGSLPARRPRAHTAQLPLRPA
jgi:glycerol-3-phosphate dehydrogenase